MSDSCAACLTRQAQVHELVELIEESRRILKRMPGCGRESLRYDADDIDAWWDDVDDYKRRVAHVKTNVGQGKTGVTCDPLMLEKLRKANDARRQNVEKARRARKADAAREAGRRAREATLAAREALAAVPAA